MRKFWIAAPTAIVVGILNVALFVGFMFVYGQLLNPGHDQAFYQAAAQRFGPIWSIVAGIPLMFLAGWWISSRPSQINGMVAAFLVWVVYFVLDLLIIAASGNLLHIFPLFFASFGTKLLAVLAGAQFARGRAMKAGAETSR